MKRYNFQVFHCHFVNAFITLTSFTHKVSHLTLPLLITLLFVTIQKACGERKLSRFGKGIRLRDWKSSQGRIFRDCIASYVFLSFSLFVFVFFSGPQISHIKDRGESSREKESQNIVNN